MRHVNRRGILPKMPLCGPALRIGTGGGESMSHTPEPWAVSDSPYGAIISTASRELRQSWCVSTEDTGRKYSAEIAVANARRIVACVNACAGIEQEDFDDGWRAQGLSAYASALEVMRDSLESERDTYRELCGELLEDLKSQVVTFEYAMGKSSLRDSNELITKAEKVLGGKNGTSN